MYIMQPSLYDYVDLGLSVKWAAWNVGATKPEEYGLYFAWGETQGYTGITDDKKFKWSDYEFSIDGSSTNFSKYNSNDKLKELETSDDAASATQSTCRMPTKADFEELTANTTSNWETLNGVNGMRFTSNINGNSIFVPAGGDCYYGSVHGVGSYGSLWSSSLDESSPRYGWYLDFDSGNVNVYNYYRYYGFTVRAIKK